MLPPEPADGEMTADEAVSEAVATLQEAHSPAAVLDGQTGVDVLAAALASDDEELAVDAAQLLSMLAEQFPDEIVPVAGDLESALTTDDDRLQRHALRGLGYVSTARPAAVRPAVDRLVALLDGEDDVVRNATWTLANIARADPGVVEPAASRFVDLLEFGDDEVHRHAARGMAALVETAPGEVEPAIPRLLDLLGSTAVYRQVGRALASMAPAYGDVVVEGLFDRLQPGRPVLREQTAWTLVPLAESAPDQLWERWPALIDLVRNDEDYQVKNGAAAALAALAAHRASDELLDALVGLLDHDDPFVRRYGCLALGDIAMATRDAGVLRALDRTRDDPIDGVADLAEQHLQDVVSAHPEAIEEIDPDLLDSTDLDL